MCTTPLRPAKNVYPVGPWFPAVPTGVLAYFPSLPHPAVVRYPGPPEISSVNISVQYDNGLSESKVVSEHRKKMVLSLLNEPDEQLAKAVMEDVL